jgi:hypothetical protein
MRAEILRHSALRRYLRVREVWELVRFGRFGRFSELSEPSELSEVSEVSEPPCDSILRLRIEATT